MQRTILYPPTIDFDEMVQRPHQLMRQFAKHGWKVYYCNKTQIKDRPPDVFYDGHLVVVHDWESFIRSSVAVDVVWFSWPGHYSIPISARTWVFDMLDDFEAWRPYEIQAIKRADIVVVTSNILYQRAIELLQQNGLTKPVYKVPNGADDVAWSVSVPERDIEALRSKVSKGTSMPIVGFIGALGWWVDITLLEHVARHFPTLVVGPPFGHFAPKGAYYVGKLRYEALPLYYSAIDVGLIPFDAKNPTSVAANPIKMFEYMSYGKPVVATDLPECYGYPNAVYPTKSYAEFIEMISTAYKLRDSDYIRELARQNTWTARFMQIAHFLGV